MSHLAVGPLADVPPVPDTELVDTDGEPLESDWHRVAMNVLIDSTSYHLRHRSDYYVGGNMFIYFSAEQARNKDFRGPDYFFVEGARRVPLRRWWAIWHEGGKFPDMIIELLSETTAKFDLTTKKDVYEQVFRTSEYYCYDPETQELQGWRLQAGRYEPLIPNERGWLWCGQLGLWLGTWDGEYIGRHTVWLRFFDPQGNLVPVPAEAEYLRAEAAEKRADKQHRIAEKKRRAAEEQRRAAEEQRRAAEEQRHRAEAAEAELARLQALLAKFQAPRGTNGLPTGTDTSSPPTA